MQEVIDLLMIEVHAEEGVSPEQVFSFAVVFVIMDVQEKNLSKTIAEIKTSLYKF